MEFITGVIVAALDVRNVVRRRNHDSEEMQQGHGGRGGDVALIVPRAEAEDLVWRGVALGDVRVEMLHLCKQLRMGLCVLALQASEFRQRRDFGRNQR